MASEEFIATQANRISDTTSQLGRKGIGFSTLPSFTQDIIEIWNCREKTTTQLEGPVFVVGHPIYSKMGPSTLSGAMPVGLNPNERTLVSVTNAHNLFPEYFDNDRFIDSSISTGSWYETDSYYLLQGSETLQTDYIAYEDKTYKSVKVKIDSEYISTGSDAVSNLSITGVVNGSDFVLQHNTTTPISNFSTDGLKIKISNTSGGTSFPLVFPFVFEADSIIKINKFNVTYSE